MFSRESPLVLTADIFPDMTAREIEMEIENMFLRSKAIQDAMSGNISVNELCEVVESTGIDIDNWAITCDQVSGNW